MRVPTQIAILLLGVIGLSVAASFFPADSSFIFWEGNSWVKIINFSTNAVALWRIDPLLSFLSPDTAIFAYRIIFGFGLLILLRGDIITTVSLTAAVACLYGNDLVLTSVIAWIPALLASFAIFNTRRDIISATIFIFVALRFTATANQFAIPVAVCILVFLVGRLTAKQQATVAATLLLPGFIAILQIPHLDLPTYPMLANVVPDDWLAGRIFPLIGPEPNIPVINLDELRAAYLLPGLILFAASIITLWINRSGWLVIILAGSTVLHTELFSHATNHISLIAAVERIVPELFYLPLAPVVFALCLFLITLLHVGTGRAASLTFICLVILNAGPILNRHRLNEEALTLNREQLVSPSYNIYRTAGFWIEKKHTEFVYQKISGQIATINASHDIAAISTVFDGDLKTTWSTKTPQTGNGEYFEFKLERPQTIRGIRLVLGRLYADFPRGIKVETSKDCSNYSTVVNLREWYGEVKFTDDHIAYPYFGSQSDVKLPFKTAVTAQCLRLTQLGASKHGEPWSIAEIEITGE